MRVRLRFTKLGKIRFTSHRDVARLWEHAVRRAGIPVAHTEGFTRRPKLSFGLALPTGSESLAEYVDIEFAREVEVDRLPARLSEALPQGLDVEAAVEIPRGVESLQQVVQSCSWSILVESITPAVLGAAVEQVLTAAELVVTRERKGKRVCDDIRPQIIDLEVGEVADEGTGLLAELGTQPRSLRPTELLGVFTPMLRAARTRREGQWTIIDGARQDPLAPGATSKHAEVRAS
ncbi:MAG: hypothetical protein JJLCMIEE_00666 [Acidimicrobiales bacterium]|nr:hypothetical protein [Acidimicrobiales bacterium]RIK07550.1 MAG: hypothetical protein DCC48_03355 [Acidobacteriota bacterium]